MANRRLVTTPHQNLASKSRLRLAANLSGVSEPASSPTIDGKARNAPAPLAPLLRSNDGWHSTRQSKTSTVFSTSPAVGQNPVPKVNINIGGKWMFIHPKMEKSMLCPMALWQTQFEAC